MPRRDQLISELLEETVRARRRRLHITATMDLRLLALQTVDKKIDRNVRALAVFGEEAMEAFSREVALCTHDATRDALVHIAAACAAQAPARAGTDDLLLRWFERYGGNHRSALRDAWWFYPSSGSGMASHVARIAAMLNAGGEGARTIGIELLGRCGARIHAPLIASMAAEMPDGPLMRASELALCRLNEPPADLPTRILRRGSGDAEDLLHALRLVAASGRVELIPISGYLQCTQMPHLPLQRLAWCLAILSDPLQAHQRALSDTALDVDVRWRALALAGFPEGLIHLCHSIVQEPHEISPAQFDALWMFLGQVPVEARDKNTPPQAREQALRLCVLQTFRNAHVEVTNQARNCAWEPTLMLAGPDLAGRRLRFGRALRRKEDGGAVLGSTVLQLGTLMRQALYIEQSAQARQSIGGGLSAYAHARHQMHVIGLSGWLAEAQGVER